MNQDHILITVDGCAVTAPRGVLLSEAVRHQSHLSMPCGGKGTCGKCRVRVTGSVTPPTQTEARLLGEIALGEGVRLACMTYATGDCTVTTAEGEISQICTQTHLDGDAKQLSDTVAVPVFDTYGVAVDIGTTTLAACLYDREWEMLAEAGAPNPQAPWGADVVSRMENAMAGHGEALRDAVASGIDGLIHGLADKAGILPARIDSLVITGNTVMLHLLTGSDVSPLTRAPFQAERLFGEWVTAGELSLTSLDPSARVYLMPCISAFVGGDTVAALMASDFCFGERTKLLADIGTNGEMALWHKEMLYVCSTAAGPAFEGAGISMGMAAGKGAVDRVTVCNGRLLAHVIGEGDPAGICGSGLLDAVACLLTAEMMDETGYLDCDPTPIAPPVCLTQGDIRAVQLAKSAINAGLLTLMWEAGVNVNEVTSLYLAGGFGSYLDLQSAGQIGLIPQGLTGRTKVLGNAALTGACMVLLDRTGEAQAKRIASAATGTDLATNPYFAETFMQGMLFEAPDDAN